MIDKTTLDTYNNSAASLAKKFAGIIVSREKDFRVALEHAGLNDGEADVLELGCGDGRDAAAISKIAKTYKGIDYSEGLLAIAKNTVPGVSFEHADMQEYEYATDSYDVVIAFASLLHIDKQNLPSVFAKVTKSLRKNGVFYVSTKWSPRYEVETKTDEFGTRTYYRYCEDDLLDIAQVSGFWLACGSIKDTAGSKWLEVLFKKV